MMRSAAGAIAERAARQEDFSRETYLGRVTARNSDGTLDVVPQHSFEIYAKHYTGGSNLSLTTGANQKWAFQFVAPTGGEVKVCGVTVNLKTDGTGASGLITFGIRADSGGLPGSSVGTIGTLDARRLITDYYDMEIDAASPISLTPGATYWLTLDFAPVTGNVWSNGEAGGNGLAHSSDGGSTWSVSDSTAVYRVYRYTVLRDLNVRASDHVFQRNDVVVVNRLRGSHLREEVMGQAKGSGTSLALTQIAATPYDGGPEYWKETDGVIHPTNSDDKVALGGTDINATIWIDPAGVVRVSVLLGVVHTPTSASDPTMKLRPAALPSDTTWPLLSLQDKDQNEVARWEASGRVYAPSAYVTGALTAGSVVSAGSLFFGGATAWAWGLSGADAALSGYGVDLNWHTVLKVSDTTGAISFGIDAATYTFPVADGSVGQSLVTNGAGVVSWATAGAHAMLNGATHTDTQAGTVVRGDVIVGDATPKWARLAKGTATYVLKAGATDVTWGQVAYSELSGVPATFAPAAHVLDSATHTVSGLTPGHFLKATGATTFGFAAHGLTYSDVGAAEVGHTHGQLHDQAHGLLTVADHSDVGTYLNQALLTTSGVTFNNLALTSASNALLSLTRAVQATDYAFATFGTAAANPDWALGEPANSQAFTLYKDPAGAPLLALSVAFATGAVTVPVSLTVAALAGYIKGTAGLLSGQAGVPQADCTGLTMADSPQFAGLGLGGARVNIADFYGATGAQLIFRMRNAGVAGGDDVIIRLNTASQYNWDVWADRTNARLGIGLLGAPQISIAGGTSLVTFSAAIDVTTDARCRQVICDGDNAGVAATTSLTNTSSAAGATARGVVGGSATNNAIWVKIYVGTTAYYIPAWAAA